MDLPCTASRGVLVLERRTKNGQLKDWVYTAQSGIHGTGLFASKAIKKGTYIGTYDGPSVKRNGTYVLWVYDESGENQATGRSGRNMLRYLNHASSGNCVFESFDLYARKAIRKDQELTFDYQEAHFD